MWSFDCELIYGINIWLIKLYFSAALLDWGDCRIGVGDCGNSGQWRHLSTDGRSSVVGRGCPKHSLADAQLRHVRLLRTVCVQGNTNLSFSSALRSSKIYPVRHVCRWAFPRSQGCQASFFWSFQTSSECVCGLLPSTVAATASEAFSSARFVKTKVIYFYLILFPVASVTASWLQAT